jgi:hypothetical protein
MTPLVAAAVVAELLLLGAPRAFAQDAAPPPATEAPSSSVTVVTPSSADAAPASAEAAPAGTAPAANAPAVQTVVVEKKDTTRMLEDGGLGLEWVYLNADVGAAFTDLVSLKSSNWAIQDNSASGPAFGIAAGVRLIFLSLGLRARDLQLSSFNLWEVDAEAALHFRIWRIDGSIGARGGYAFLGKFSADSLVTSTGSSASNVTVHGWNVGPTVDLDVYITKHISVGVDANAEALFLKRPALPLQPGQTIPPQYQELYADSGSSIGAGFVATAHLGVHF